jgi:hypothetical protein
MLLLVVVCYTEFSMVHCEEEGRKEGKSIDTYYLKYRAGKLMEI